MALINVDTPKLLNELPMTPSVEYEQKNAQERTFIGK